jgi:carbon monoxide dehydrogenase subunit G
MVEKHQENREICLRQFFHKRRPAFSGILVKFDISRLKAISRYAKMIYVEVSDMIQAPREEVFALNADFRNWAGVFPDVSSVRLVQERYEERVFEVVDSGGHEKYTVVQRLRAPEKILREIKKRALTGKAMYTLTSTADGTLVTFTMAVTLRGYYRLLSPFMKGQVSRSLITHFLQPLKRAAEARGQAVVPDDGGISASFALNAAIGS